MMGVWERLISCGTKASCKIPNVRFIYCPTFVVKKKESNRPELYWVSFNV